MNVKVTLVLVSTNTHTEEICMNEDHLVKADYVLDGSPESVAIVREARGLAPLPSADYDHGCRYGPSGLPSCLAGTRDERWWCKACSDHALIRWLVETVHYPFDFSFSTPPPVDHHAIADHWNAWDGWDITAEEAYACVAEEAGLHDCATCSDCLHDGNKCCGCYDNSCCQTTVIAPEVGQ